MVERARAAALYWNGCDRRPRATRSPSRSRYHSTVASIVSSWGEVVQPSSRLALVLRYVHHWLADLISTGLAGGRPGPRSSSSAIRSASGAGSLSGGGSTPLRRARSANSLSQV